MVFFKESKYDLENYKTIFSKNNLKKEEEKSGGTSGLDNIWVP